LNSRSEIKNASDPESIRARALKFDPRRKMSIMAVPSKSDLYPDPVAVATGVFGHDLGLGEGFEGAG